MLQKFSSSARIASARADSALVELIDTSTPVIEKYPAPGGMESGFLIVGSQRRQTETPGTRACGRSRYGRSLCWDPLDGSPFHGTISRTFQTRPASLQGNPKGEQLFQIITVTGKK
jgi:hypothetical protein